MDDKKNKTIPQRVIYLLVFLIIFFSNDTTLFGTNMNQAFVGYGFMIEGLLTLVSIVLYAISQKNKILINKNMVVVLLSMVGCIVMSAIVNQDFRGGYATSILMIFLGFFVTQFITIDKFCIIFADIFKLLAGGSIIGKIVTDVFPALRNTGFYVQRSTGLVFRNYILYARSTEGQAGSRNYSIFREPGVFQAYLIAALIISIIYFDKKRKKHEEVGIIILVVATLMTKSTTAYIGLMLVLLFYIIREGYLRNRKKFEILFLGVITSASLAMIYFNCFISDSLTTHLRNSFIDKFDSSSSYFESGFARIASIGTNISLWLQNPVFGVGLTQKQEGYLETSMRIYGHQTSIDTNTVIAQFSLYGFLMGIIWIFAVIGLSKAMSRRRREGVIAFLIIIILLMTEYLVFSSICNVFIWYGLRMFFSLKVRVCFIEELKLPDFYNP